MLMEEIKEPHGQEQTEKSEDTIINKIFQLIILKNESMVDKT